MFFFCTNSICNYKKQPVDETTQVNFFVVSQRESDYYYYEETFEYSISSFWAYFCIFGSPSWSDF